jgi:predicted RNase H-like HicB family nuclease
MKYKTQLKKIEEGFAVWCPDLPGCWSQGKTKEEALKNIEDAIKAYLETKGILKPADESFAQGWKEAMNNQVFPIEQLFETESEHEDIPPFRHLH